MWSRGFSRLAGCLFTLAVHEEGFPPGGGPPSQRSAKPRVRVRLGLRIELGLGTWLGIGLGLGFGLRRTFAIADLCDGGPEPSASRLACVFTPHASRLTPHKSS